MGRELAEGRVHVLERDLNLHKKYVDDMRRTYQQLEDHSQVQPRANCIFELSGPAYNGIEKGKAGWVTEHCFDCSFEHGFLRSHLCIGQFHA